MSLKFKKNIVLRGQIETLTGLHIGGSKEKLEIGGVDSPVIRDPNTSYPFIPGSSLKGKMRMLLEFAMEKVTAKGDVYESKNPDDEICRVFGNFEKGTAGGPTRLVVRDAYPSKQTVKMWESLDSELQFTELKPENTINRLTSEANPRFLERVVKGSFFNLEMIYSVYDEKDEENLKLVYQALRLLEHSGLGGSISRGYGRIKFRFTEPLDVSVEDYKTGSAKYAKSVAPVSEENNEGWKSLDQISTI
ncbi:MAG: type III-A CRISPR-associated RAMP protein Csm3 [Ignavibacteriales bacterium]|jgi:CRISPR-associated protein Csm3|nr:type III-A CRISPR-associated RAMP protein Csm3 [Ignavibacteriales bacterium]